MKLSAAVISFRIILMMVLLCSGTSAPAASCVNGPVWLGGADYAPTIQAAYDALNADATLFLEGSSHLGTPFSESVLFSGKNLNVRLSGGYGCSYAAVDDYSVINGVLTVASGTVEIANIVITTAPEAALAIRSSTPGSGLPITVAFNGASPFTASTPCDRTALLGDAVQLTAPATAPNGNLFTAWSGCDSTGSGGLLCNLTLTAAATVTAAYHPSPPPTPIITTMEPASGPVGTVVTLTGSGFTGASAVAFNGVPALFTVNSATGITTGVPNGAGSGTVTVTTPGGTASSPSPFTVTVLPPDHWTSRGVGGGGALYSPAINPANANEYYVSCDMSEVFHTTDFGDSYGELNAAQIQGGHYSAIRFTADPNILYSLSYANGNNEQLVKSTDGGATWIVLAGDPWPDDNKYSIFADSSRTDRVIMSGWSEILSSTDGGASFKSVYSTTSDNGILVGGAFFDGNNVYLGTSEGLLVSHDGGGSFTNQGAPGIPTTEAISSFAGAKAGGTLRFFVLTGQKGSVYPMDAPGGDYWGFIRGIYSLDNGSGTWTSRMTGIDINQDYLQYLSMANNDINTVYAGGSDGGGAPEVMVTTDGGLHWTNTFLAVGNLNISTGWSGDGGDRGWGYGEVVYGLAVAPNDSSKAVFTDMGFVHRTVNRGTTWQQAYVNPADQHPPGVTAIARQSYHSNGLENTSCWQLVWSDAQNLFAAFSDIGGIRSTDGGLTWSFNRTGLAANTTYRIVRDTTGTLYAATSDIHDIYQSTRLADSPLDNTDSHGDILYSTDKGGSWQLLHHFGHPVFWLDRDPNQSGRMYASVVHSTLGGIYLTNDLQNGATSTWTRIPNPARAVGHPATVIVLNDGKVLCTFSGRRTSAGFTATSGLFLYNPVTSSWSDLSDPGMYYWTKDVILDPADSSQNSWYVAVFSGWGGAPNGLGGLYRTTDRGAHWARISSLDRVTSLTFDPLHPDDAYLTTEYEGLWHSENIHGAAPVFDRLTEYPFKQPERVFFNPFASAEIWISSFGNGLKTGTLR